MCGQTFVLFVLLLCPMVSRAFAHKTVFDFFLKKAAFMHSAQDRAQCSALAFSLVDVVISRHKVERRR
jgi:hypothetical protein